MNRTMPPLTASAVEHVVSLIETATSVQASRRQWDIVLVCGHVVVHWQHAGLHIGAVTELR